MPALTATCPRLVEKGTLRRACLPLVQLEAHIRAEQRLTLIGDARLDGPRNRSNAANGADAERDAGDEDQEAGQARRAFRAVQNAKRD